MIETSTLSIVTDVKSRNLYSALPGNTWTLPIAHGVAPWPSNARSMALPDADFREAFFVTCYETLLDLLPPTEIIKTPQVHRIDEPCSLDTFLPHPF